MPQVNADESPIILERPVQAVSTPRSSGGIRSGDPFGSNSFTQETKQARTPNRLATNDENAANGFANTAQTAAPHPSDQSSDDRDFDSDDSDYIPEDENWGVYESAVESYPTEEAAEAKLTPGERLQTAVQKLSPEIKDKLQELLRGQFVLIRKYPRSKWI